MPSSRWFALPVLVFLLFLAPAPPAHADGEAAEAPAAEADVVEFTLTQVTPMQEFLSLVRKELGLPLVWNHRMRGIQGKEMAPAGLRFRGSRDEALRTVRGLLAPYELVLVPIGRGVNRKYVVADVRQSSSTLRMRPEFIELTDANLAHYEEQDGHFVTTMIPVKHLENLRDARNALNRVVTGQNIGYVSEVPAANAFVVTDFAPKVVSVYRLLQEMDIPPAARDEGARDKEVVFRAIGLEHAEAEAAARVLQQHFGIAPPPPGPHRPGGRAPRQARPPNFVPAAPTLRIDADVRLNQLLVTGMRKDVARVAEVVSSMDRPIARTPMRIQVVPLEHLDAVRAAAALTALIQRSPATWLAEEGAEDLPVVVADGQSGALLIHAGEAAAKTLRRLIGEMDRPRPGK